MNKLQVVALLLLLACARFCFGQAAAINGQIEGTITDPTGAVVPNVNVTVTNVETGFTRTLKTDEAGFFRFPVLPLGTYNLTAESSGFTPTKQNGITVSAGAVATVNLTLGVAGTSQNVVVTGDAPVVEPGRTDLGNTLSSAVTQNLPLLSRNPYNFILDQPNMSARPNTEFGVPRKINANGFTDRINYELDGNNNTESDRSGIRLLPISDAFISEVQNVNNGFSPEFGYTVGTVFNAITKSGTNDFHGELQYIIRRPGFNARPTLLARTAPKPDLRLDSYVGDAGGRIVKDKVFWYGSFEHDQRGLPSAVTVTPAQLTQLGLPVTLSNAIPFSQDVYFYMGKLDWQINDNNRLSLRINYFRNESPYNNGGGLVLATQTYLFKDRAPNGALQLISTITPNVVNEFRFGLPKRLERQVAFTGTGPQPAITVSGVAQFGGSPNTGVVFEEVTPEGSENLSISSGNHTFKLGADIRYILDNQTAATYTQYTFGSIADYLAAVNGTSPKSYTNFTQTFGNAAVKYNDVFLAGYAQDNWKVNRNLTLIYGVRYDVFVPPSGSKSALFPFSQTFHVDENNVAPRLGFAYAFGNQQKTVMRANYGIFYDAPPTNIYYNALLFNGAPQFFNVTATPQAPYAPPFPTILTSVPTGFSLPSQTVYTVDPHFRNLYSENANFQIDQELTRSMDFRVNYLYSKGTHIPVYRNLNVVPTGAFLADGRPILRNVAIYPQFANVLSDESVGNSNYNGLNLTFHKRFSRGYDFFATYTWSHALDNAPEQNVLDSSNMIPEDPTNRRRDYGNSLSDRRHALTTYGVIEPHFDVSGPLGYIVNHNLLSFNFTATAGDTFNIGSNRVLNGDPTIPAAQQRPAFIGRNTVRGPNIYQMDLRYGRRFPIGERVALEFFGEFTNLFNHPNITAINTTATVDALGNILTYPSFAPTTALDSRLMQLGARLSF